jgi:hypothetical protein
MLEVQVDGSEWRRTSAQILVEDAPCAFDPPPVEEDPETEPEPVPEEESEAEPTLDADSEPMDCLGADVEEEPGDTDQRGVGCGCTLAG